MITLGDISSKKTLKTIFATATSVFLLAAFISVPPSSSFANAFMQNQNTMGLGAGGGGGGEKFMMHNSYQMNGMHNNNIPQIKGTIDLRNSTAGNNTSTIKNASVPFITAAQSAQSAIANGKIIRGHIGITQGFLTYKFAISNPANNTISHVIVDAGNGKVLYTSPGIPLNSTQFAMRGMNGGFGFGLWGFHDMNNGFGHWGFGGHEGSNQNQRW